MRKFKHKKTGHIFEQDGSYYNRPKYEHIPAWLVEDSNDWEEIIEKDYEILSFVNNGKLGGLKGFIVPLQSNGIYGDPRYPKSDLGDLTLEKCITAQFLDIHSVRRISDGEIFTIGDKVKYTFGLDNKRTSLDFNINRFLLFNDKLKIEDTLNVLQSDLEFLIKSKQPLFTTEDGVDIFEGDWYYELITPDFYLNSSVWNILKSKGRGNINYDQNYNKQHGRIWFSTEEKAQEYIDLHKPKYSINDLNNASKIVNTQIFKGYVSIEMILFNLGIELKKLNK